MMFGRFFLLILCTLSSFGSSFDFNLLQTDAAKGIVATGFVGGLLIGKKFINGPVFDEKVSLNGKIAVITGANTGLGKETALKLASLGAKTILLCKSLEKGTAAKEEIIAKTGNNNVDFVQLDLADLKSVKKGADVLSKKIDRIDILVNNAGVMAIPTRQTTKDGFEAQMGINHLGHFALTGLLLKLLKKDDGSGSLKRIVNLASQAHLFGNIQKDDLMLEKPNAYQAWNAYGNSKIANIYFTHELKRRLKKNGINNIVTVCCHPGLCRTELGRYMFDMEGLKKFPSFLLNIVTVPLSYLSKSPFQGAQTSIFLSASNKITMADSGKYYDKSAPAATSPKANDEDLEKWLWEVSEKLTGVKYL